MYMYMHTYLDPLWLVHTFLHAYRHKEYVIYKDTNTHAYAHASLATNIHIYISAYRHTWLQYFWISTFPEFLHSIYMEISEMWRSRNTEIMYFWRKTFIHGNNGNSRNIEIQKSCMCVGKQTLCIYLSIYSQPCMMLCMCFCMYIWEETCMSHYVCMHVGMYVCILANMHVHHIILCNCSVI